MRRTSSKLAEMERRAGFKRRGATPHTAASYHAKYKDRQTLSFLLRYARMLRKEARARSTEDVSQGDYGYERGEFDVFPDLWRPLFDEGLTPQQAFRRALDAHAQRRREEDEARQRNWQRIQKEDGRIP